MMWPPSESLSSLFRWKKVWKVTQRREQSLSFLEASARTVPETCRAQESSLEILTLESKCWARHCSQEALGIKGSVFSNTRTQLAFWTGNWTDRRNLLLQDPSSLTFPSGQGVIRCLVSTYLLSGPISRTSSISHLYLNIVNTVER